jgi:cob(I)alamin adenosyltransferase
LPRRPDEPVRLTRIYTRGGDSGETSLGDGSRVSKLDPLIRGYGAVDELNSVVGWAQVVCGDDRLAAIQNELFDVGADLANPVSPEPPAYQQLRIDESYVTALESACDEYNAALPVLRSFVLPGGTPGAALLHTARAVTRRAERSAWAAVRDHGETVNVWPAKYLNRLSDLLFILARAANAERGDVLWRPGGDR